MITCAAVVIVLETEDSGKGLLEMTLAVPTWCERPSQISLS